MKITQVNGNGSSKTYKLLIISEIVPCDITIIGYNETHKLHINVDDVDKFAKQIELSIEAYTKQLFQIFNGETTNSFIDVQNNEITVNKSRNIKFFSKQVQMVNYAETIQIVTDHLYRENCIQNEEITKTKAQNNNLNEELQKFQERLDTVINNANKHEDQLYSCLIQILNEKKKYITLLKFYLGEDKLKRLQKSNVRKKKAQISDSDSDDYDTDFEKRVETLKPRKRLRDEGPSTSNTNNSSTVAKKSSITAADSNVFDSDDSDVEEIFCTALPPRSPIIDLHTENTNANKDKIKKDAEIFEDVNIKKFEEKEKEKADLPINATPVITYSTQDLLDDI